MTARKTRKYPPGRDAWGPGNAESPDSIDISFHSLLAPASPGAPSARASCIHAHTHTYTNTHAHPCACIHAIPPVKSGPEIVDDGRSSSTFRVVLARAFSYTTSAFVFFTGRSLLVDVSSVIYFIGDRKSLAVYETRARKKRA